MLRCEECGQRVETALWQTFTRLDCFGIDGWYTCGFGEGVSGTAIVVFSAVGPRVTFTAIACNELVAGAYPQGCTFPP